MKITIYELLGMIKDDKAPKKIEFDTEKYIWCEEQREYRRYPYDNNLYYSLWSDYDLTKCLNDIVDIIEAEKKQTRPLTKKDIEALGYACGEIEKCFKNGWNKSLKNKPLEEQKKIPEKLELPSFIEFKTMSPEERYVITAKEYDVLNEIIDYLESKGNE